MIKKKFTRRGFKSRATAGLAGVAVLSGITSSGLISCGTAVHEVNKSKSSSSAFALEVERVLPPGKSL